MKYKIGDNVELKNGCIVIITDIKYGISGDYCYIADSLPIPEKEILRKIEN